MKRMILWVLGVLALFILAGCSSIPSFDERIRPLEPICSEDGSPGPCPGGQLCLNGRCFEACLDASECAARESCIDGVCVDSGEGIDGGMFDAGTPVMACNGACDDMEVCDIRTDDCVSCFDGRQCSGETPICDYSRGECIPAHAGDACRPCNESDDCLEGTTCVLRTAFNERVCMAPCAGGVCPTGFTCNTMDDVCEPALGGCTQLRRSLDMDSCATDVECVARRKTAEPGACNELTMTCRAACDPTFGCPEGWMCDGMNCLPPPAM